MVLNPGEFHFHARDQVGLSVLVGRGMCLRCEAGQELFCAGGRKALTRTATGMLNCLRSPRALRDLPPGLNAGANVPISGDTLGVPARASPGATRAGDRILVVDLGPSISPDAVVRSFAGCDVLRVEPPAYR